MYNFLFCCNASAFVICAIKNYLVTYLLFILGPQAQSRRRQN